MQLTNDLYSNHLRSIMEDGLDTASPRGLAIKEILGKQYKFNLTKPAITIPERKIGYKFMAAEAAWILSGNNRVDQIEKYSKYIWEFSDNGIFYFGSYGPKIIDQLSYILDSLKKDKDSRQAVINIWRENPYPTKDMPCSTTCQFLIRDNKLNIIWNMRSSDGVLGVVYDQFNIAMLAGYVLLLLNEVSDDFKDVTLGEGIINMGSAHIYESNFEKVADILNSTSKPKFNYEPFDPLNQFSSYKDLINHLWSIADGKESNLSSFFTESIS